MKKTVLMVLMALVFVTPCLAQEVEPDGIFRLDNTLWLELPPHGEFLGFAGDKVYRCSGFPLECWKVGLGKVGLPDYYNSLPISTYHIFGKACDVNGYLLPFLGIGIEMETDSYSEEFSLCSMPKILLKVRNNWTPFSYDPALGSIAPNQGEQESILLDVEIVAINTSFQGVGSVNIFFSPPDGLTISNVTVISNTELEFDLQIAADAPPGIKSVTVTYGFPAAAITGNNVFEVLPRSN